MTAPNRATRYVVRRGARLAALVLLAAWAAGCYASASRRTTRAYEGELEKLQQADFRARSLSAATLGTRTQTLAAMAEQNSLLFEWSVVLLGATAALVTTSKVRRIGHVETVYVLLAPAAILLLGSIEQGIRFQRSHTFLIGTDQLHAPALNPYLFQQGQLMLGALACIGFFVVVFYLLIVFGGADPTDDASPTA